jgi:2-amino-4-hydroxy-6-hydroxymethyldihydropteridine diphosphokinase
LPEWAFISLGSNIEPEEHLSRAAARLSKLGEKVSFSRVYQSAAVGPTPQPDFLNAAAKLWTGLYPSAIRRRLRTIEAELGRVRSADKFAPRTIDLDLCLFGDTIVTSQTLVLPDPGILTHAHIALPLAELAPDFPHPETNEPLRQIAQRLQQVDQLILREDLNLGAG